MATDDDSKHKPSPKHTLDEVLKSLQDLVRNDLLDENPPGKKSEASPEPAVPRKRGRPRKEVVESETPPPASPRKAPRDDLDAVLASLEELVGQELSGEESSRAIRRPTQEKLPADGAAASVPARGHDKPPTGEKPRGDQHEFSFDAGAGQAPAIAPRIPRPTAPAPQRKRPAAAEAPAQAPGAAAWGHPDSPADDVLDVPPATDDEAITVTLEAVPSAPEVESPAAKKPAAPPVPPDDSAPAPETAAEAMDIPVLEDAVAFPLPLEEPEPLPPVVIPGFEPAQVRKLAVRVVARLNIELRKKGERPVKAKVIDRLQRILAEELESLARNMENKRP